jgi:hypothetical protein
VCEDAYGVSCCIAYKSTCNGSFTSGATLSTCMNRGYSVKCSSGECCFSS